MDFFSASASAESPLIYWNGMTLSSLIDHFNHIFKVLLGRVEEEGEREDVEKEELILSIWWFPANPPCVPTPVAGAASGTVGCVGALNAHTWTPVLETLRHPSTSEVPEVPNPPPWAVLSLQPAPPSTAPREANGADTCAAALPFPRHFSQQPHVFDCIYGHLICASSQDQIYLQVLISFRLIEVQAHEVSVFDPQIGYESQSNRLIFTRSRCPGLQAAREKSMKSANDSQFIEQLPF